MKRLVLFLAALAVVAVNAFGDWVYEGEWGREGVGKGEFKWPNGISVASNSRVYVADFGNDRVQYFTGTGSFLGHWSLPEHPQDVVVGPSGRVYVSFWYCNYIARYTPTGSLLSTWSCYGDAVAVSPGENVYCTGNAHKVSYFTSNGSLLGSWGSEGGGNGQFYYPEGVAVAPNGNVYVADTGNNRVQYFTSNGSYLGLWPTRGGGVAVAPHADVFVSGDGRVRQFTATGSYVFDWSLAGVGRVAVSPSGARVYVTDGYEHRVVYYRESDPAVSPASLGKVKALFK
jgi:tripartite motif-containing protein 71